MKRKYLSALLMGVLTLTSVSTFTSCKDYDDDISNLQGQIDKLATADQLSQKVSELQALIASNKSDISSLQSELAKKTTLDEVKAVLADYATKEYVDGADATLQAAIKALETGKVAELEAAVKAAQAAADKAAEDAKAANAEILETLKTLATKAEVAEVQEAAKAANDAIVALQNGDVATLKAKQAEILETLKTVATQNDLKDVADAAQKALDAAQKDNSKALADLDTAVKNAQSTADAAKKQAADNLASINGLATTVQNASDALTLAKANETKVNNALAMLGEGYSKDKTVAAAITAIQAQIGTPDNKLGSLDTRLAAIESVLNGVKDDDTKLGLATKVTNIENKLKDIIGEYTTMVTEVSLMGSILNDGELNTPDYSHWPYTYPLQFMSGEVAQNYTFGKEEMDNNNVKITVDNQQKFVKNTPFNDVQTLVVRVNPTNAVLTKDMVKLVNSQGDDLDGVLEIDEVNQYRGLLTRASKGTGLWEIKVKVKEGVASSKIEQTANVNGATKHVLYAVAVKNTKTPEKAEDRYVASTYDITVPAANPFVATTNINAVRLWSESTMTEQGAIYLANAKKTTDATTGTVVRAKNNETINIDFKNYGGKVKYFYVVRDDSNTDTNSDQSELNAWKSYQYDGTAYGKVIAVDPKNPGTLKINIGGTSVADDEIGFRIFAINYDGILASSAGGQSFVVYVGDEQTKSSVSGSLAVTKTSGDATGWLALNGKLKDGTSLPTTWSTKVDNKTISFNVAYSKDGKNVAPAGTKNSDIKFVKFTSVTNVVNWKDNLKAEGKITTLNAKHLVENEISVSLTKVLPTVASTIEHMGYKWKDAQVENGKYTAYVYPAGNAWTTANIATGYKNMTQAINGLKAGAVINVENVVWNGTTKKFSDAANITGGNWTVSVDKSLIDGTTEHPTHIGFNYGKISSETKDNAGNVIDYFIPVETVQTVFACPLTEEAQTYKWKQYSVTDANGNTTYYNVNHLTYGNTATVANVNLLDYIIGSNKFDTTVFGGKLSGLVAGADAKYVTVDAKLISKESKQEDYFKASVSGGVITFTKNSLASNPVKDVESTLVITLTDAFGHKMVYNMPFTVYRAK